MIEAAALALADARNEEEVAAGLLYPRLPRYATPALLDGYILADAE